MVMISIQAIYCLITTILVIGDISSSTLDIKLNDETWLIKALSAILLGIALCLFRFLYHKGYAFPLLLLCLSNAFALAIIDFWFVSTVSAKWQYTVDGCIQSAFVVAWLLAIRPVGRGLRKV